MYEEEGIKWFLKYLKRKIMFMRNNISTDEKSLGLNIVNFIACLSILVSQRKRKECFVKNGCSIEFILRTRFSCITKTTKGL